MSRERPETKRGPPHFEKGAESREGREGGKRGGMSKQYYSKGAKKRENVLPASQLVTHSFILHPPLLLSCPSNGGSSREPEPAPD